MKIIEVITHKIVADEGKLLRKKATGRIAGNEIHLGYNHYDLEMLTNPYVEKPDDYEEIDIPKGWEDGSYKPDPVNIYKQNLSVIERKRKEINAIDLDDNQCLELKEVFPIWAVNMTQSEKDLLVANKIQIVDVGQTLPVGFKFQCGDKLMKVLQEHSPQPQWNPLDGGAASLYAEVHKTTDEEGNVLGTIDNPIPYNVELAASWAGMELEKDKYYTQRDVVYLCIEGSGIPVYHELQYLSRYVQVV
jgi:hypothetical protein